MKVKLRFRKLIKLNGKVGIIMTNKLNFSKNDIIESVKTMSRLVTDDCTWAGVVWFACELLGCSEEDLEQYMEE